MRYILALFILICSSVSVPAQVKVSNSKSLSAAERNAALQSIEDNFQKIYVLEEMRPLIVEHLKKNAETKRYDVSDPYLFAERITQDLKDVAKDEHLYLKFDPAAYAAAIAPPKSDAGDESFRRNRAIRSNHGLTEMRILPGNIRYLKIIRFEWVTDETGAIYDEAMRGSLICAETGAGQVQPRIILSVIFTLPKR